MAKLLLVARRANPRADCASVCRPLRWHVLWVGGGLPKPSALSDIAPRAPERLRSVLTAAYVRRRLISASVQSTANVDGAPLFISDIFLCGCQPGRAALMTQKLVKLPVTGRTP